MPELHRLILGSMLSLIPLLCKTYFLSCIGVLGSLRGIAISLLTNWLSSYINKCCTV